MKNKQILTIVVFTFLCMNSCVVSENSVKADASQFLQFIRSGQWEDAAKFVYLDEETRRRLDISSDDIEEIVQKKIIIYLKGMYADDRKPGKIQSVKAYQCDSNWVWISYMHGDLDAFTMLNVEGKWYYTLDHYVCSRRE